MKNDFFKNLEKKIIENQMKVVNGKWEGFDLATFLEIEFNILKGQKIDD